MKIDEFLVMYCLLGFFIISFISLSIGLFYDGLYVNPIAANHANEYCQANGFDFYESYKRIGLFSKNPVAIKCKFVEQYRLVDLNIDK